jgi:hypothetical protein
MWWSCQLDRSSGGSEVGLTQRAQRTERFEEEARRRWFLTSSARAEATELNRVVFEGRGKAGDVLAVGGALDFEADLVFVFGSGLA